MRDTTIDPTTVSREIEESAARAPRLEVDQGHRPGGDNSTSSASLGSPRVVLVTCSCCGEDGPGCCSGAPRTAEATCAARGCRCDQ